MNIRCVFLKHKRNFKKDKVETVIVLATKISRSQICSFNVQLMQSKLSYYKIRSGAKYLEGNFHQTDGIVNLSQIQSALIISEGGGM